MKQFITIFFLSLIGSLTVWGADASDSVGVHFRQSHIVLDPAYRNNGAMLDSVGHRVLQRGVKSVKVTGGASPEGSVKFNEYLSQHRAKAIFEWFESEDLINDSVPASFVFLGRDWHGLQTLVEADENVPYRADVLELLSQINGENSPAHPLLSLKRLHGGEPYIYMYHKLFPQLRESHLVVEYLPEFPLIKAIPPTHISHLDIPVPTPSGDFLILVPQPQPVRCRPFYMGLKTNLLYDALLLPTVGAEFYVGKGWSVTADWTYGWWDRDHTHYYWRAYGGNIGARKWFGRKAAEKPLTGHHIGAFAGVITYDFELGGKGYMGGLPGRTLWDRCNYVCGIEYGYSLPIARRLNIDFSIALGYIGGKYIEYVPNGDFYQWKATHRLNWVGPTKAEISLVWLIGCDNYNRSKGGRK